MGRAVLAIIEPIYETARSKKVTRRANKRVEFWVAAYQGLIAEVDALLPRALELMREESGSAEDHAYSWRLLALAHSIMIMALIVGDDATRDEFMTLADDIWDNSDVAAEIEDEQPDEMGALLRRADEMSLGLS